MSHVQGFPSYHVGSSSSSSFDSQVPSYREHTPSPESDRSLTRSSLEHRDNRDSNNSGASYSPRHSRRYSQRRPLSPAERAVSAHYANMASGGAPTPPQDVHDPMRVRHDALGRFFGEQFSSSSTSQQQQQGRQPSHYRTHSQTIREQREEAPVPQYNGSSSRVAVATIPPPYDSRTDVESLPVYTKESEYDAELNRKLFIYGFLFFPLWIVGIIAPFVKPHRDPVKDNRSKEAQDAEDASMRAVELMWAKRCAFALAAFILVIILVVIIAVLVANHK